MAKMYPNVPRPFERASKENLMFEALKYLPDDYYVFHSINFDYWGKRSQNDKVATLHEHQADFIVLHRQKGILIIEGKAGEVYCKDGIWYQINKKTQTENTISPYDQSSCIKWDIFNAFEKENIKSLTHKCKFQHAVWFVDITKNELLQQTSATEINQKRTLTHDALDNIQEAIDYIYSLPLEQEQYNEIETNLSDNDFELIISKIFNPAIQFSISEKTTFDTENKILNLLLNEQKNILNYLEEQRSAIISGVAGTGKTFIAIEKARRHSINGEKVLFLCYNKRLNKYLIEKYEADTEMDNVYFYTIDKLSYEWCGKIDYTLLKEKLYEKMENFPFKHIIIDEGQDFGKRIAEYGERYKVHYDISICNIIQELSDIVLLDETKKGSFYIFYDKHQLIHCDDVPAYIKEADCKLTLYTNCRNTDTIAKTSTVPIKLKNLKILHNNVEGSKPQLFISSNDNDTQIQDIENVLQQCISNKIFDIQILTCTTFANTILAQSDKLKKIDENTYKYFYNNREFDFTTCRKFKGLEAQVVILIDVSQKTFTTQQGKFIFYVGASRAKNRLYIISKINQTDYQSIADSLGFELKKGRKASAVLENYLDVEIVNN